MNQSFGLFLGQAGVWSKHSAVMQYKVAPPDIILGLYKSPVREYEHDCRYLHILF